MLETNPGPGLGILLALYLKSKNNKQKKEKYASFMFVHFIGGLHEIYFPEVLANLWLLPSLIAGSIIGNICFIIFNVAATGVISPGSIFTVCLMCVPGKMIFAVTGVFISAIVSGALAFFTLTLQEKNGAKDNTGHNNIDVSKVKEIEHLEKKMIRKIGFVCNAGVGSSSMGAALFRRKLRESGVEGLEVNAYAADQIPSDLDLIICQKDLKELMLQDIKDDYVYAVDNLLNQTEYIRIIEEIQKTGGLL